MELSAPVWRVHRTSGAHVLAWNELRTFGFLPTMRWDPHPAPATEQRDFGVLYAAGDIATCLAEAFQAGRRVDTTAGDPALTMWTPARTLRLLNITDTWPIRNGAAAALDSGPRSTCRAWAHAIHQTWPDLDGIYTRSTMTGRPSVVFWHNASDAIPTAPEFSRELAHPMLWSIVDQLAAGIGYKTT